MTDPSTIPVPLNFSGPDDTADNAAWLSLLDMARQHGVQLVEAVDGMRETFEAAGRRMRELIEALPKPPQQGFYQGEQWRRQGKRRGGR